MSSFRFTWLGSTRSPSSASIVVRVVRRKVKLLHGVRRVKVEVLVTSNNSGSAASHSQTSEGECSGNLPLQLGAEPQEASQTVAVEGVVCSPIP